MSLPQVTTANEYPEHEYPKVPEGSEYPSVPANSTPSKGYAASDTAPQTPGPHTPLPPMKTSSEYSNQPIAA